MVDYFPFPFRGWDGITFRCRIDAPRFLAIFGLMLKCYVVLRLTSDFNSQIHSLYRAGTFSLWGAHSSLHFISLVSFSLISIFTSFKKFRFPVFLIFSRFYHFRFLFLILYLFILRPVLIANILTRSIYLHSLCC